MTDNLKPTVIDEIPFPSLDQVEGNIDGSGTKDVYTPQEIKPISFPAVKNIKFPSIDLQARAILSPFAFGKHGAIEIGNYSIGAGVRISPNGIVGGVANVPKFTLNALTGDATFAGTLAAGVVVVSGALTVGTNVGLGTAQDASGVTTIVGNTVTTGYVNALNVQAKTVAADWVYAGSINCNQLTAGSITVGGSSQPTALIIQHSTNDTNSRLRFEGGSRIWEDSSDRVGINSLGSPMYIYVNSTEKLVIPSSGQITLRGGAYLDGNVNVTGDFRCNVIKMTQSADEANIEDVNIIKGHNDVNFQLGNDGYRFSFYNTNYDEKAYINSAGKFHSSSSQIQLNGTDKTAIVKTSNGFNTLYCAEAPEVWFFDFCETKKKIDPLFLEVTEGEMRFIKCDKGYQVWRRRKGHAGKRFESKTAYQFMKNETFLKLAK